MENLTFTGYTDPKYSSETGSYTALLDPDTLKFDKQIEYAEDRQLGAIGGNVKFVRYKAENLSFMFTIDCTGIVEGTKETDRVYEKIKEIENLLYVYNTDGHRPSYVKVLYGTMVFHGQVKKFEVDYTLFDDKGNPLRALVSLAFTGFRSSEEERKKFSRQSPDMSRLITVKEGEKLPYLCYRIYGDSLLVREVARFNDMDSFRDIPAGTQLLFPPLKKD